MAICSNQIENALGVVDDMSIRELSFESSFNTSLIFDDQDSDDHNEFEYSLIVDKFSKSFDLCDSLSYYAPWGDSIDSENLPSNIQDDSAALLWACTYGHEEIATGLLQKRKAILAVGEKCGHSQIGSPFSVFCASQQANVNSSDAKGRSVLYWSVKHDLLEVATLLLEEGAIVDAVDSDGRSPLSLACEKGLTAIAGIV